MRFFSISGARSGKDSALILIEQPRKSCYVEVIALWFTGDAQGGRMVQVVFVHGVATRGGIDYENQRANRDKLFKLVLFGQETNIAYPLWGDLMPRFEGKCFAKDAVDSLSLGGGMAPAGPVPDISASSVLPKLATVSPASAIDLLLAERIAICDARGLPLTDPDLRAFAAAVALLDEAVAANAAKCATLAAAADDAAFVAQFLQLTPSGLSLGSKLTDAAKGIADRAANALSKVAFDKIVKPLNPHVAIFLGDVFRYLKTGELRNEIRVKVRASLADAWAARQPGEKLVLIGHSLGGVILYDLLSEPVAANLPAGFRADALVTVGSQPGLFQELGLFDHAPGAQGQVAAPVAAGKWINTFDPIDPFGFPAAPIFSGLTDYEFDSVTSLLNAHTTYFMRPQFYARLRRRLITAGVLA